MFVRNTTTVKASNDQDLCYGWDSRRTRTSGCLTLLYARRRACILPIVLQETIPGPSYGRSATNGAHMGPWERKVYYSRQIPPALNFRNPFPDRGSVNSTWAHGSAIIRVRRWITKVAVDSTYDIPWNNCTSICTNGAAAMMGNKNGFISCINKRNRKTNTILYLYAAYLSFT